MLFFKICLFIISGFPKCSDRQGMLLFKVLWDRPDHLNQLIYASSMTDSKRAGIGSITEGWNDSSQARGDTLKNSWACGCRSVKPPFWRLQGENHTMVLKRGKSALNPFSKAKADSDGKEAMNILQAGSSEPHSRWHGRVDQKPIGHGRVKFLIVLSDACGRRGPQTCTPPPQSDYAVNWMHKQAVWDEFGRKVPDRQRCRLAEKCQV